MSELKNRCILVTGGAGFIGSALVRDLIRSENCRVVVVDKLTYAANLSALNEVSDSSKFNLETVDICNGSRMREIFENYRPDTVMHLAAESHVDRSIDSPSDFITTNVNGTFTLLEVALAHWSTLNGEDKSHFRFLHVSTDEVYGSLGPDGLFSETTAYAPNSPYSASKAASDHLVRAWNETFDLPVLTTNCTNNYGPFQFLEKLIPTVITKALANEPIPIYGKGLNVRDWLFVDDHVKALKRVLARGTVGETYCIGGNAEKTNIEVVTLICELLDELVPPVGMGQRSSLITYVKDRPGHDARYAMDISHIKRELDWQPSESFESGMRNTVKWYLNNRNWWEEVLDSQFDGKRLGIRTPAEA